MIKITTEQKELLLKHLPDIEDSLNSNELDDILDVLDDLITDIGFDDNWELNETGLSLQLLYDQIYSQN